MRYALNFLVVIAAALLWTITFSANTHAADASWNQSGAIRYNNQDYQGPKTADGKIPPGLTQGVQYYEHITPETDQGSKARILALPAGVDPKDTTQLQYSEYDYDKGASDAQKYTNGTSPRQLTIDKQPANTGQKEETSCVVGGVGFIVCPIMNLLANAMDKVFELLKSFLVVKPLALDRENGLFKAWQLMLAFANVLFVIGFLVIIYSYVTNQGVNQYDLRNIIPRLIVAAVLINVSYYICAAAVDISNVLGANLQDLFNSMRQQLQGNEKTDPNTWLWSDITTFILSAGTIGGAGYIALGTYGAAALHLLMPMLIGAVIALLVVIIVLAARQALITILIIVAPIAFAAFILPSTQKYFDKWKDVFMTMLIMYPMFSVLFGGSQLAAALIAQNATSVLVVLFAMFIQVAPLVITPFLIKFSGSLLGRIAGMVNNPAKGLGDRAKNWSKGKADLAKDRRIANGARGTGLARRLADGKRRDEALKKRYETKSQRNFNRSRKGRQLALDQKLEDDRLARADKLNDAAYEELKRTDPKVRFESVQLKIADMTLNANKAKMDTYLHELESAKGASYHAGRGDVTAAQLGSSMHKLAEESMVQASRQSIAQDEHKAEYATNMVQNAAMQAAAGGIGGEAGRKFAVARATQTIREDFGKEISAAMELYKHFSNGIDSAAMKKMALGDSGVFQGKDSQGNTFDFQVGDIGSAVHEAAVTKFIKETNFAGARDVLLHAGDHKEEWSGLHNTIKDLIRETHGSKAAHFSGQALDMMSQGNVGSGYGYNKTMADVILKGKLGAEKMATTDADALKDYVKLVQEYDHGNMEAQAAVGIRDHANFVAKIKKMAAAADFALTDDRIKGSLTDNVEEQLKVIRKFTDMNTFN